MRVPDYGITAGVAWPEKQKYTISLKDAAALYCESKAFAEEMRSGRYIYVEGYFCKYHSKYVMQQNRTARLTAYARAHIDECCIAFQVSGWRAHAEYMNGGAYRKTPVTDKYHAKYDLSAVPGTTESEMEDMAFIEDARRWHTLLKNLPKDKAGALDLIMQEKGISQTELANRLGVDRTIVYRIRTKKCSKGTIVGVCIALQLPYTISIELLRLHGQVLSDDDYEDGLFSLILQNTAALTIERCNEILEKDGRKPLFFKSTGYEESRAV